MKVTARATRSGDWWAIEVPEVVGVYSQAKLLVQVADVATDAVATMLDLDPGEIEVRVEPVVPAALSDAVTGALEASAAAAEAQGVASRRMRAAVVALRGEHYTLRDAASLLGVTHQRIAQLERTKD